MAGLTGTSAVPEDALSPHVKQLMGPFDDMGSTSDDEIEMEPQTVGIDMERQAEVMAFFGGAAKEEKAQPITPIVPRPPPLPNGGGPRRPPGNLRPAPSPEG